jgi:hypothetical protein
LDNQLVHADKSSEESIGEAMLPQDHVWQNIGMPYAAIIQLCAPVKQEFTSAYVMFFGS